MTRWVRLTTAVVSLAAPGAMFVTGAAGHPARVICPTGRLVAVAGTPADLAGLVAAVRLTVPRVFGSMANQAGGGAWRGYRIREIVSLAPGFPETQERRGLHAVASSRCGTRVADAFWAVRLTFPEAQTIPASSSTIWFLRQPGRWSFWLHRP